PALDGRVSANQVNLRAGPGTHYPIVGKLAAGADIQIVGRNDSSDWLRICCPVGEATESWISAALVLVDLPNSDALTHVPIAAAPPAPAVPAGGGRPNQTAADIAAAPAPGIPG